MRIAPPGLRLLAFFADIIIIGIINRGLSMITHHQFGPSNLVYYVILAIFFASYSSSPGKLLFGLKIVDRDTGQDVNFLILLFIREIFGKFISAAVLMLGFIWILFDQDAQGWHDKFSNTIVIRK